MKTETYVKGLENKNKAERERVCVCLCTTGSISEENCEVGLVGATKKKKHRKRNKEGLKQSQY